MKINKFISKIKQTKFSVIETAQLNLKICVNKDRTQTEISGVETYYKRLEGKQIIIQWETPQNNLSVFQAGLLFMLFALKKKPNDYAAYHKCIAGVEFISNIKNVRCI